MAERIGEKNMILEEWMIRNLKAYGNCAIGNKFLKKHGEENIIQELHEMGYVHARIEKRKEDKRTKTEIANGQEHGIGTAIIYTSPNVFEECKKTVKK